jgi:nucleoside-diphosphate-sugar epimerase
MPTTAQRPRTVMVTGAGGNLGQKVVEALARQPWCTKVIGIDRSGDYSKFSAEARERLELVKGDLTVRGGAWTTAMAEVDAVIHFAALHPLPDASWEQALASYDMTLNLLLEAAANNVERFVFASSNHAMGAYKDLPLAAQMGPGKLTTELPPAPGTRWHNGDHEEHSLAYGTSKVMGEKLCAAVAELAAGELSAVSVRVGWSLTGANDPRDITHSGSPASSAEAQQLDDDAKRALRWFRNMWLSNGDLERLFIAAVLADSSPWPAPAVIINGVSNNRGMDWDLSSAAQYLGYQAQDDLYRHVDA